MSVVPVCIVGDKQAQRRPSVEVGNGPEMDFLSGLFALQPLPLCLSTPAAPATSVWWAPIRSPWPRWDTASSPWIRYGSLLLLLGMDDLDISYFEAVSEFLALHRHLQPLAHGATLCTSLSASSVLSCQRCQHEGGFW